MWYITIKFDFGTRYVRYAQLSDGTWLTGRRYEAKEWKTFRGARRWLNNHPELLDKASIYCHN